MKENHLSEEMNTPLRDYSGEIISILGSNLAPGPLRERLLDYHPNDIASAMAEIGPEVRKKLYSLLDIESLSEIFEYATDRTLYMNELNIRRKVALLSALEPAVAVEYLEVLEKSDRQTLLELLDADAKCEITLLSSFDVDEIGSRMSTNYIAIPAGSSIKSAMSHLVSEAADNDNISTLYVTDASGVFGGAIDLKDLIIARKDQPLESITVTSYPYVYASEPIDDCMERLKNYAEDSIPVLDSENRLVGVLIAQDILELVEEEIGDDYAKLGGLSGEEDLRESLWKSIGKRLPWLAILLGLGLMVSGVVGAFEDVVAHLPLIICFQSLILGMAGNAGTQSLAVTVRVLSDESLTSRDRRRLILKEGRVGLFNGIVLGILSVAFIGGYILLFKGEGAVMAFSVSGCAGLALSASVFLSSLFGTVIPLLFKRIGIDPAVASGPLITTVNDLVAVLSYYGLAWALLV